MVLSRFYKTELGSESERDSMAVHTENFTTVTVAKSLIPSKSVFNCSYWIPGVSISVILYFGVLWTPRGLHMGVHKGLI